MESNWATEHLQVIRTLMERAAVYRRALAPIMLLTGIVGSCAAVVGWSLKIDSARPFIAYWMAVSLVPLAGSFLLVRTQALRDHEQFWSPPTRRVTQALLPPFVAGLVVSTLLLAKLGVGESNHANVVGMIWLPVGWVILYGCAIHAAGFFMPRGIKLFGWGFILGGCALFALGLPDALPPIYGHLIMGGFFGLLHLAYGIYLYFTEKRKNEA
jgi:hypothetical protein